MQDNKANRVVLLISLVLAVLATILIFIFMNQQDASRIKTRKVVVAKYDLPAGKGLNPSQDFAFENWPESTKILGRTVDSENLESLRNKKLNQSVRSGDPILLSYFSTAAEIKITPGMVALSLPVRGANALSGLLVPGDKVRVLVTKPAARYADTSNTSGDHSQPAPTLQWLTSEIVKTDLRVIAVGSKLTRIRQQFALSDNNDGGSEGEFQTVTLEVTQEQARTILQETGAGQLPITLILCTPAVPQATETSTAPSTK